MLQVIFFLLLIGVIILNLRRLEGLNKIVEKGVKRFDEEHLFFVKSLSKYDSKLPKVVYLLVVVLSVFIVMMVFSVVIEKYDIAETYQIFIAFPLVMAFISFVPIIARTITLNAFGEPPE